MEEPDVVMVGAAAAVALTSANKAHELGAQPLLRLVCVTVHGG